MIFSMAKLFADSLSFYCLLKSLKWLFFILESVIFDSHQSTDALLHNPKWRFFHLDPKISCSLQQITDALRVTCLLMYVYEITNFIIFTFEQTQNFKRFECMNSKLLGSRHCKICAQIKDTMKAYFCYRHTLLETRTLSRLFYLFQNYPFVLLMDVFN